MFFYFFFYFFVSLRDLHSFPTRRSSDLSRNGFSDHDLALSRSKPAAAFDLQVIAHLDPNGQDSSKRNRSEEHTSELQSLRHLVCRLLLEKKNKPKETIHTNKT